MNEYRITLTKRAADDITNIGDYIAFTLSEPNTSRNFIKGLRTSISRLKLFPYKFPLVPTQHHIDHPRKRSAGVHRLLHRIVLGAQFHQHRPRLQMHIVAVPL